jgi:uncharacterized protein (DUF488 family)
MKNLLVPGIAICGKSPDWFTGKQYKKLAPKWSFFKDYKDGVIDSAEYTQLYYDLVLSKLNPYVVLNELIDLNGGSDDFALLCYERPDDFCHRHIVAGWLSNLCGIEIHEASNQNRK